jgi:hypothetical protein
MKRKYDVIRIRRLDEYSFIVRPQSSLMLLSIMFFVARFG